MVKILIVLTVNVQKSINRLFRPCIPHYHTGLSCVVCYNKKIMGIRRQPFIESEYYHLYNRGIDKKIIFLDKEDYNHFLYLMYVCNTIKSIKLRDLGKNFDRGEVVVYIGAYCLMANHFHILVRAKDDLGVSRYMSKLLTAYAMYFNKKYSRTGRLFANTFKSSHINNNVYFKYIYAYIHLNPAKLIDPHWKNKSNKSKIKLLKFIFDYPYSSLSEYLNLNIKNKKYITNLIQFPDYFINPLDHKKDLFEWLTTQDNPVW